MGYRGLERNFRCRYGEIDIIGWDGDCLAFVEVRSHSTSDFGEPAESIGPRKRERLQLTAQTYLAARQMPDSDCRFDVVEVIFSGKLPPQINVIKSAFDAE